MILMIGIMMLIVDVIMKMIGIIVWVVQHFCRRASYLASIVTLPNSHPHLTQRYHHNIVTLLSRL